MIYLLEVIIMVKEKGSKLGLCGIVDDLCRTIEFFEDGTYKTNVDFIGVSDSEKSKTIENIIFRSVSGKEYDVENVGISKITKK